MAFRKLKDVHDYRVGFGESGITILSYGITIVVIVAVAAIVLILIGS